ncbi:MAG: hydrolase TatD [Candidatus Amulumruptor caecigallinarius]|nr:MAG: hydrolase TatD [Candidatus Amulumruptor caecigallinarius]
MTRCRDDILKSLPLPMIAAIYDVHTHDLDRANAVVNLPLGAAVPPEGCYSVGIHPWDAGMADGAAVRWLRESAADSRVVAIGETGFDALRGGDMDRQEELFREHASLSRIYGKPMIIHNVRGTDRLISIRRELRPAEPWIIHGFRGKPELARQLVREGFYLSVGERFNRDSLAEIPAERLLLESDDSAVDVREIARMVGTGLRDVSYLLGNGR